MNTGDKTLRIGIVGLGANTRLRHVPGFQQCRHVQIVGVVNRRPESTATAAKEFGIPKTYKKWDDLVADPEIDAVVIGTWPYLHCPITLAALENGKHVLTEARMAMNVVEAFQMLAASRNHPELVTQIVPSPLGLRVHRVIREMIDGGFLGALREFVVLGVNNAYANEEADLHWRQSERLSGVNLLALGILHETLIRWISDPVRVFAQIETFVKRRADPETGELQNVGTPDVAHVLTELPDGARGIYHLSSAVHFGPPMQIHLYGSQGTIKCHFIPEEKVFAARAGESELREIEIPPEKAGVWRVEEEFVGAIRGDERVQFTDFETGVRYMRFTQAVVDSSRTGAVKEIAGLEDQ